MNAALRRFAAILRADLLERTRSLRFWVVLGLLALAIWWCFPPITADYLTVSFGQDLRGRYSSAWIGIVLAMQVGSLLSLVGFYVVRGTLLRDFETRVWQLLVATPMTRAGFLLAKWISHVAVLSLLMLAGLAIGLVAQWVRAEDRAIDLVELAKPTVLLALPGLALTAAFAIWFDLLPWLRRSAGNVLFFFVWMGLFATTMASLDPEESPAMRDSWLSDASGVVVVIRDLRRALPETLGEAQFGISIGMQALDGPPTLFDWPQWSPRPIDLLGRALWLAIAAGGVLLAVPWLDWAAARTGHGGQGRAPRSGRRLGWLDRLTAPLARGRVGTLLVAELRLVLRQRRLLWWLALAIAIGLQAFASGKGLLAGLLLGWLLPLDVHARSLLRERDNGTAALVFAAAGIRWRLLLSRLLLGLGLAWLATLPGLLRLAASAPDAALAALLCGASVAVWGLASAALTRSPRLYELVVLLFAYVSLQGVPALDPTVAPALTQSWHGALLLVAATLLVACWPRLARAT